MPASKQLVFIPKINPNTWLLLSRRKGSTCLRDYSMSPRTEERSYSLEEIETLLSETGSYTESLPAFGKNPVDDEEFWREQIAFRNIELRVVEKPVAEPKRLLDKFKKESRSPLAARNANSLRGPLETWKSRFEKIKDKAQFNHWDNDCPTAKVSSDTGIGWTSQLLIHSRKDGRIQWVRADEFPTTSFSLLSMELALGIPKQEQAFHPDKIDYIKPDGLGIRENGHFTVLEVKGPQDDRDWSNPMLQGVCGALAVFAKRRMICTVAKSNDARLRPGLESASIPKGRRSLGVHVLTATENDRPRRPWTNKIEEECQTMLDAFHELSYIAFSCVKDVEARNLTKLTTDVYITPGQIEFSRRFEAWRRR